MKLSGNYLEQGSANPVIVGDTNHAHSNKQYQEQPRTGIEVMQGRKYSGLLQDIVRGLMVESCLMGGTPKTYGKSINDPCSGWNKAEVFVRKFVCIVYNVSERVCRYFMP